MQKYTALIAQYPSVMIDVGGSTGDDDSLSCFNDAFHQVQEIATHPHDEIIRAKKIKRSAQALMNLAAGRQQGLSTSLTSGAVANGGAPVPVPNGRNAVGSAPSPGARPSQGSKKLTHPADEAGNTALHPAGRPGR